MKSSILNLAAKLAALAVITTGLVFSTNAQAQTASGYHYKANIPFQFMVENKTMPAGTYFVDLSGHFIRLTLANTNKSIGSPMGNVGITKVREHSTLVFNVYGNQYFLAKLLPAGSETGKLIPQGTAEREVASLAGRTQVEVGMK